MKLPRLTLGRTVLLVVLVAGVGTAAYFGGTAYQDRARSEATFAAAHAKKPTAMLAVRAADEARLHAGPVPIEEAMRRLAERGRLGLGKELVPEPSTDQAPLMGWSNQPRDVPDWMMATSPDAGPQ